MTGKAKLPLPSCPAVVCAQLLATRVGIQLHTEVIITELAQTISSYHQF